MSADEHLSAAQFGRERTDKEHEVKPEVQARINQVMAMGDDDDELPPF
jgi:hypothetical protein